jgi:hypothetical protein
MTDPGEGECLLCFLRRAVAEEGCPHTLHRALRYRDEQVPAAVGLERRLRDVGAACDCAVLARGWWPARSLWQRDVDTDELTEPEPWPGCAGVGSTTARPCAHWVRRTRWDLPPGW